MHNFKIVNEEMIQTIVLLLSPCLKFNLKPFGSASGTLRYASGTFRYTSGTFGYALGPSGTL